MIDDQVVLKVERLRDDVAQLRLDLRKKYPGPTGRRRQVTVAGLREQAGRLAETWLVDIAGRRELVASLDADYVGDLTVHFTRLLTMSQQAAMRSTYEAEINGILADFTMRMVIPLKRLRHVPLTTIGIANESLPPAQQFAATAFLGHSFDDADLTIANFVKALLEGIGVRVVTGEKPRAARISDKIKRLIDDQHIFVGLFTRRDRVGRRNVWTTSSWVIDEKAYAVARDKVLVLITEDGVDNIGGLQGDYEYIKFERDALFKLAPKILSLFTVGTSGVV